MAMTGYITTASRHAPFMLVVLILAALLLRCKSFHTPSDYYAPHWQAKTSSSLGAILASSGDTIISYAQASQIRTLNGHDAAIHHYRQLLLHNPQDSSAATRIAASEDSLRLLARVGWPYSQLNENQPITQRDQDWENDIEKLNQLLNLSNYRHSPIRRHIFNLPTGIDNGGGGNGDQSLQKHKNDYPMGPTYIRPLVAGQSFDPSKLIGASNTSPLDETTDSEKRWLPSLQCLATLFLLSSCVPKQLFLKSVIGGEITLELFLRLNIVFIFDAKQELGESGDEDDEWIVPLVHLFPIEMPSVRNAEERKYMALMTDLQPIVLGMTSIPIAKDSISGYHREEGAVMYIGPDSLALVHHLHASMLQYAKSQSGEQALSRILDVCTGSGVQALATLAMLDSLQGKKSLGSAGMDSVAVAVDINERALRFTRFNARLNGLGDKIVTVHANLLSGNVFPKAISQQAKDDKADDSIIEEIVEKLIQNEQQQLNHHDLGEDPKFDIFLANPPFIPVPPARSDAAALSIRDESSSGDTNAPRYGLFSSGGASGEDCLCAIVKMAPSLLKSDGGLMAVVSEFMNPPPFPTVSPESGKGCSIEDVLTSKIEEWWSSQSIEARSYAEGALFTNQYALSFEIYAERRAMTNDQEDINVWKNHLCKSGIHTVSPGLLFVQTKNNKSEQNGNALKMKHSFVSRTESGSIWTPHNAAAVEFTRGALSDLFR